MDKGNQDFAFSIERVVAGEPWALVGVADGASQSTWAARGARHAAAAFIEAFDEMSSSPVPKGADLGVDDEWLSRLTEAFHGGLRRRLHRDRVLLIDGNFVDPTWDKALYRERFGLASQDQHTETWFQSTLLAGALGPHGALALFLGDGYYRIDRLRERAWESQEDQPQTQPAGLRILRKHILLSRIQIRGVSELALFVATDGVSKSPPTLIQKAAELSKIASGAQHGAGALTALRPSSSEQSARFLEELARLEGAEQDNMSLAFASRRFA